MSPSLALVLGLGCALVTAVLLVVLRPLLARYALARPNARSSHKVPTPQGGGIAIVLAACAGIALAAHTTAFPVLAPLASALALAVVGAADDILVLPALPRLVLQLAAAATIVLSLPSATAILPALPGWLVQIGLVLALVWFVNLVNFMDGIDWITVAEVVPICAGLAIIAALGRAPDLSAMVAIAVGGATLGFAPFNRPVARLFLGDVGSLPLGLLLGWQLIVLATAGQLAAAILLPLYYLADATLTLGRRILARERIWEAHRTHFYQRATDRGFAVIAVVARVFVTNLVLVALAVTSTATSLTGALICLSAGIACVAALLAVFRRGKR